MKEVEEELGEDGRQQLNGEGDDSRFNGVLFKRGRGVGRGLR